MHETAVAPLDLGDPRLRRLIVRLALPTVAGLGISALHHVANAAFVGMLGPTEIAAVSIAVPLFVVIAALGEGLGIGAATAIGRHLGSGARARASATATTALALTIPLGAFLSLVLLWQREPILGLLGASGTVLPDASRYAGILGLACVLLLAQQLCDFIAIAEGNTRFSMWTLLGAFSLNIVLDPILIFGFGLGVAGAAVATIISQVAALLAYAVYFRAGWGVVRVRWRLLRTGLRLLQPVFGVGVPATFGGLMAALSLAAIYGAASLNGGDEVLAGVGIALRLVALGTLPVIGFCLGAQPVLSFACGAGDFARMLGALRFMLVVTSVGAAGYALVMITLAGPIAGLFTEDPATLAVAIWACRAFHACFALAGVQFGLIVLLQSLGKGWTAAMMSFAAQGGLLILALLVLPAIWGLGGVIASPPVAGGLAGLLGGAVLLHEMTALRRLAGEPLPYWARSPGPTTDMPGNARLHRAP